MRAAAAVWLCALALNLGATRVAAQAAEQASDDEVAAGASAEGGSRESGAGEPAGTEGSEPSKPANEARNWSFGPYFRLVVVPAFMLKLFLDAAPSPTNVGFGAAATYRTTGGTNFEMGIGYTGYGFTGPFRTKGGDENDTEIVKSNLGFVHLTGSVLWEAPIAENMLSVQYGFGLDLGIVTGKMTRTEAYPLGNGSYAACTAPGIPNPQFCQAPLTAAGVLAGSDPYNVKGEQYGVQEKSIPPIMAFPMLPRLGLRYAPIPDFWVRLDAAYGIAQFWFGLSAAYVPKM